MSGTVTILAINARPKSRTPHHVYTEVGVWRYTNVKAARDCFDFYKAKPKALDKE